MLKLREPRLGQPNPQSASKESKGLPRMRDDLLDLGVDLWSRREPNDQLGREHCLLTNRAEAVAQVGEPSGVGNVAGEQGDERDGSGGGGSG